MQRLNVLILYLICGLLYQGPEGPGEPIVGVIEEHVEIVKVVGTFLVMVKGVTCNYPGGFIGAKPMLQSLCNAGGMIMVVHKTLVHGETTAPSSVYYIAIYLLVLNMCMHWVDIYMPNSSN